MVKRFDNTSFFLASFLKELRVGNLRYVVKLHGGSECIALFVGEQFV